MTPLLEVRDVSFSYHTGKGETKALSHISFSAESGQFIALVGPSGCGKSTLLNLLSGLTEPETGSVLLNGRPVSQSAARIGYMFQRDCLLEWRSVLSNLSLGLEIQHRLTEQAKDRLSGMLETYGLGEFASSRPSQLSGGMRQRAALIRTLALEPDLLLLDEPFSALDYQTRLTVCDDICTILRQNRKNAVLVTHDLSEAISAADRILVLSSRPGRLKAEIPLYFSGETSPMRRRQMPEFSSYFNLIWKEMTEDDDLPH